MKQAPPPTTICSICKQANPTNLMLALGAMRSSVVERIKQDHPAIKLSDLVCPSCATQYRGQYISELLEQDRGELSALDLQVIKALKEQELITANLNDAYMEKLTPGQAIADKVARFGGSWAFIISFSAILLIWIVLNMVTLWFKPFDPYPFILLNLVLSSLAALQAPIIMMSQNRQAAKDRIQAEHDYRVNLKAELEVRLLHTKLDQLLTHQWQRLIEIQQLQLDLMEEIRKEHQDFSPKE